MITADKKIKQRNDANLTDYTKKCPEGLRSFFAYVNFTDYSWCLYSNIFAKDRSQVFAHVLEKFSDCIPYLSGITIYSEDGEN